MRASRSAYVVANSRPSSRARGRGKRREETRATSDDAIERRFVFHPTASNHATARDREGVATRKRDIAFARARDVACVGFCARCSTTHALVRTKEAEEEANEVRRALLRAGRLDADVDAREASPELALERFDEKNKGKMIGVLIARTRSGGKVTLKAFSGQAFGARSVVGWAPPVGFAHDDPGYERKRDEIAALSAAIAEVEKRAGDLEASARALEAASASDVERARGRAREKRAARRAARELLGVANDERSAIDREALDDESRAEKREIAELKRVNAEANAPTLRAVEACRREANELKTKRKILSRAFQSEIWDTYRLTSLAGDVKPLREAFYPPTDDPPCGCGDCAAPKLLAYARALDVIPLSIAEFWLGASSDLEFHVAGDGVFYGACREKCQPILGHLLCPVAASAARANTNT